MAFHQILSIKQKLAKNKDEPTTNALPYSTKGFIEQLEKIIKEYNNLQNFIDSSTDSCNPLVVKAETNTLYLKAFCNGLTVVLDSFRHTLASIEESCSYEASISLLDISTKLSYFLYILPRLNIAVNKIREENLKSSKILDLCGNLISSSPHGIEDVFRKIQQHCLKPFYMQTKLWITQAEFCDPYCEFFIIPAQSPSKINDAVSNDTTKTQVFSSASTATGICKQSCSVSTVTSISVCPKYQVNPDSLPSMIPLSVAMKILFIGDAITICQHGEADSKNNERVLSKCGISEQSIASQFAEIERSDQFSLKKFSSLVNGLWTGMNKYIRQISDEIGNINEQLYLMWEMFLLGRGELFQEFLCKGSSLLNSDVTFVDGRQLNKAFRDAVYNVYLTDNSELTEQFYFKLPDKKVRKQGVTVWTVMELKCKIKWPLYYVFTKDVMHHYNGLFNFLMELKKAEIDITSSQKIINSIKNHVERMELIELRMQLLVIILNFKNYCFTNVIASEMTTLLECIKNTVLFTDIQKALHLFLENISNRLFLPDSGLISRPFKHETANIYKCFRILFTLCGSFADLDGKSDEYFLFKLRPLKTKLESTLNDLFSLLSKIDKSDAMLVRCELVSNFDALMMCLDYNGFFRKKFNLDVI